MSKSSGKMVYYYAAIFLLIIGILITAGIFLSTCQSICANDATIYTNYLFGLLFFALAIFLIYVAGKKR